MIFHLPDLACGVRNGFVKSQFHLARRIIAFGVLAIFGCLPALAQFHDAGVFKATLVLPAQMVVIGVDADTVSHITLNNTTIVNLALGRPLATKVDPKTEILAAVAYFESHSNAPLSKLVVYDPTKNGQAGIRAVVATLQTLTWQNAYENTINTGFGFAVGTINATTLGSPAQNGFLTSAFSGGGSASGKHLFSVGDANASPKATVSIEGQAKFVYTDATGTHNFDGIFVGGKGTVSGKPIGGW